MGGCLGTGACAVLAAAECAATGIETVGVGCLAFGGALDAIGCLGAIASCLNQRRAVAVPKKVAPKRRNYGLSNLVGCLGTGACAVLAAAECAATGIETVGVGCLAFGGALDAIGCLGAIASCLNQRRAVA